MADMNDQLNKLTNTPDSTDQFDPADVSANQVMAILAYIGILVLIPIFAAKGSKYARFHANQGLTLCIAEVVLTIVCNILGIIPILGFIFRLIGSLIGLAAFIMSVIGIINVANNKAKELPFIGSIKLLN
ncbi:MAG: hypothetical protein MJ175_02005 [Clostridia bacterium]|nr:hypothetical protein [Clostridia bacterium]